MTPYTKTQIKALIASRWGGRSDTDTIVDFEMQLAQTMTLEGTAGFLPSFLIKTVSSTLTSGTATLSLKAFNANRVLRIGENGRVMWGASGATAGTIELIRATHAQLFAKYGTNTGTPAAFAIDGDTLTLFPTPNANCVIFITAHFQDTAWTDVASGANNLWMEFAADWFIAEGMRRMAMHFTDEKAMMLYAAEADAARKRVMEWDDARRHPMDRREG
ncbi:MAG: hypothetical protein HQM00_02295 [Magnetococcales bacterium]|nr:hypothetical protein [Magnetococcales bacterium]